MTDWLIEAKFARLNELPSMKAPPMTIRVGSNRKMKTYRKNGANAIQLGSKRRPLPRERPAVSSAGRSRTVN
jgi:hypothetical protein